jgi:HEAT repeat protein
LLQLAEDEDGAVRAAAYESLGLLEASEGAAILRAGFDDANPAARQAAVLALGRVEPGRSTDVIVSVLSDARPEMRFSAVWTLAVTDPSRAREISGALEDDDEEVRLLAAQCLGELGARSEADAIAVLLEDGSERVGFGAAVALAALGDARGARVLRVSLGRPDRALEAAIGLGDLQDRESHAALRRLAKHRWRSPILRAAAARALVRLGDPEGATIIRRFVRSWRIEARQYAVELVGELGLVSLVPDLARAYRRSRKSERAVYETALRRLAAESSEAQALLASVRGEAHPV